MQVLSPSRYYWHLRNVIFQFQFWKGLEKKGKKRKWGGNTHISIQILIFELREQKLRISKLCALILSSLKKIKISICGEVGEKFIQPWQWWDNRIGSQTLWSSHLKQKDMNLLYKMRESYWFFFSSIVNLLLLKPFSNVNLRMINDWLLKAQSWHSYSY